MAAESVSFAVGKRFFSYEELKLKITAYENARSTQICHSDFRTLEVAKNRVPCEVERAKKHLVYYQIELLRFWWQKVPV